MGNQSSSAGGNASTGIGGGGGKKKSSTTSRSNRLTDHMIRERHANVFNYYQDVRRLGEGSIGTVRLVKRKKGTEGGSAYDNNNSTRRRGGGGSGGPCACLVDGIFGCSWFATQRSNNNAATATHRNSESAISDHSEMYALKSIQLRLVQKEYLVSRSKY